MKDIISKYSWLSVLFLGLSYIFLSDFIFPIIVINIFIILFIYRNNNNLINHNNNLKSEIELLSNSLIDIGGMEILEKNKLIKDLNDNISKLNYDITRLNNQISSKEVVLSNLKKDIIITEQETLYQTFGLYTPVYDFNNSDIYKSKLIFIREQQKKCISNGLAVIGNMSWMVHGSISKGNKMVKDTQKLLLRAFNSECDFIINKVTYNNFEQSLKRINQSCELISKLGNMMGIEITKKYLTLKVDELTLAFEYKVQKQKEKEDSIERNRLLREEAKLKQELENSKLKILKEQNHYLKELESINNKLLSNSNDSALLLKQQEIKNTLSNIENDINNIDYRASNQKAGYVYIISNIGSFGEHVYKIGVTRRLVPEDRVNELSSASVPFKFDIHAMIFSKDAFKLEAELHEKFRNNKVNIANLRKEFFKIDLKDIKKEVLKYDNTVEFIDIPEAEEFRISNSIRHCNIS